MARYRKKPIEVEAYKTDKEMIIHTLEGDMKANVGDYIITGIKGEQYPCKPEIFEATYEISTADVVPKSEVDKLEYTITGVMHSVDKWLDGDELEQDEVNRAATMREKTLRIIETLKSDVEDYRECWQKIHDSYNADCLEHYNKGRQEVAREIFEEIEKKSQYFPRFYFIHLLDYNELKKKYTESEDKG